MKPIVTIDISDIETAIDEAGLSEDASVRPRYSGRCMYGEECLGLVTRTPGEANAILIALGDTVGTARAQQIALLAREDAMGLRMITYYPGVAVTGAPEDD